MSKLLSSIQWKVTMTQYCMLMLKARYILPISPTFHKLVVMKSIWYSAVTQSENIVALFFLSREADFSTRVSKSVFPLLRVSMTVIMAFPQTLRVMMLEKLHWRSGKSKSCIWFGRYHPFTENPNRFSGQSGSWTTRLFLNLASKHQVCHQIGSNHSTTQ